MNNSSFLNRLTKSRFRILFWKFVFWNEGYFQFSSIIYIWKLLRIKGFRHPFIILAAKLITNFSEFQVDNISK